MSLNSGIIWSHLCKGSTFKSNFTIGAYSAIKGPSWGTIELKINFKEITKKKVN